ncbi:MAG: YchJ family metal-binding protein [Pseudomonadales bacterium]|jgi:SEC-C motif-containing protein|nr:YchJ family metal-binding protein [Pseudomonadales bacterium]
MTPEAPAGDGPCPCGGGRFGSCCGPILAGAAALTAEALMRSRYTAFTLGDARHLRRTWHPDTCPAELAPDPRRRWLGLRIRATAAGAPDDDLGTVEFVARYKVDGRGHRLHELSEFVRQDGRWVYLRGTQQGARR